LLCMVGPSGLEPPTSRLSGVRSNQLSYGPILYGAGDGNRTHATSLEGWSSTIELHPRNSGREDRIRTCDPLVPNQMRYQAALLPVNGVPGETRTPNLLIRSQTLYPIELRAHNIYELHNEVKRFVVPRTGIEPVR
jgi:hypothetical protein